MQLGFPKKEADDDEGAERREVFRNMEAEAVQYHYNPQNQYGIHGAVFEVDIFLYVFYVSDCKFPYQKSAQAVAEQNKRHGKSKGKCAKHAVYGESCVYYFQKEKFTQVRVGAA